MASPNRLNQSGRDYSPVGSPSGRKELFQSGEIKNSPERKMMLGSSRQLRNNTPESPSSSPSTSSSSFFSNTKRQPLASEPSSQYATYSPKMDMIPFPAFDDNSNSNSSSNYNSNNSPNNSSSNYINRLAAAKTFVQSNFAAAIMGSPSKQSPPTSSSAPSSSSLNVNETLERMGRVSRRKTVTSKKDSRVLRDSAIPFESIKTALTKDLIKEENFFRRFGVKRTPLVPDYLWLERDEGLLFPEAFSCGEARTIRALMLDDMNLLHIPPDVFEISNLSELDLSRNQLIRVSPLIRLLFNLRSLNLSQNQITTLPPEISKIKTLHNLCISFNPLSRDTRFSYWKGKIKEQWAKQYQTEKSERTGEPPKREFIKNLEILNRTHFYYVPSQSKLGYFPKMENMKLTKMDADKLKIWEKDFANFTIGSESRLFPVDESDPLFQYSRTHNLDDVGGGRWSIRAVSVNKIEKAFFLDRVVIMSEVEHSNVNQIKGVVSFNPKNVKFSSSVKPNWVHKMEKSSEECYLVFTAKGTTSLKDLRMNHVKIPLKKKMMLAQQICSGMALLHKRQIIHHNLKSSNILLMDQHHQVPKIADYVLGNRMMRYYNAESSRVPRSNESKEEREELIPYWMAPEILENEPYDYQIDVYSFGILLLEILNDEQPFNELKSMEELRTQVCVKGIMPKVKQQKPRIPMSIESLIEQCLKRNPKERPDFESIEAIFESLIIESALEDEVGADFWAHSVKTQCSLQWKEFSTYLYKYFKVSKEYINNREFEQALKSILVDSDDAVTMEQFIKMTQFHGPLRSNQDSLVSLYKLHSEPWFIGELSVIQTNDLMADKGTGAYLVRYSSSEPGCYVLCVKSDDGSVKQYKIKHSPGTMYAVGDTEWPDIPSLIAGKKEYYGLKVPAQKMDKYSDSNAWSIQEWEGNSVRKVPTLKRLCFRYIYLHSNEYQGLLEYLLPADVLEDYRNAVIEAATSDETARSIWKTSWLNLDEVPFRDLSNCIATYLGQNLRPDSQRYNCLKAIVDDIADNKSGIVSIETFSKLMEWFGPLDGHFLIRISEIIAESWFHGNLSHTQAERLISKHPKVGTFLVRFSGKNRGYFTLSVMTRTNIIGHYRIHYNRQEGLYLINKIAHRSLVSLVRASSAALFLKHACPDSKYASVVESVFNG